MPDGLLQGTTTETVEAWFNTTSGGVIIGMQNTPVGGSPSDWQPVLYVGNDGLLRGKFWDGRATQGPMTSSVAVNDGNWHHVAIVADFDNQNLYLDGNLIASVSGFISHQSSNYCQIGTGYTASSSDWPSGNGEWFDFEGRIDDVRVWNVARTQAEISAGRNSELVGDESGLTGYWNMNSAPTSPVTTTFLNGMLSVLGSSLDDTITIRNDAGVIKIDANGSVIDTGLAAASVTSVSLSGGGGNDTLKLDASLGALVAGTLLGGGWERHVDQWARQ